MRFIKLPIIPILIVFVCGILVETYSSMTSFVAFVGASSSIIILCVSYIYHIKKHKNSIFFGIPIYLVFFFLGIVSKKEANQLEHESHFSKQLTPSLNLLKGCIVERVKPSAYYTKYVVEIEQTNGYETIGKLLVFVPKKNSHHLTIGTKITIKGKPIFIEPVYNPYQFDYTNYLNNQNIYHSLALKENAKIELQKAKNWRHFIFKIKETLLEQLKTYKLTEDDYNLIAALVFGERTTLSAEVTKNYTQTGVIHILAISGLHIALFYSIILGFLNPLKKYKKGKLIIFCFSLLILWGYALLTGLAASILRAVVVFSLIAYGKLKNRSINMGNILAASAFIILLYNPNYLFDIGFQLSYAAVLSLVLFQPIISKLSYSKYIILLKIKQIVLVTLVAQIGVLPLNLYYFGQFPLLFLVTNLVVIPLSSALLLIGLCLVPISFLPETIRVFFGTITSFLIKLMNGFTAWICQFDIFIIQNIAFHSLLVITAYLLICALYLYAIESTKTKFKWVLICVFIFQMSYIYLFYYTNPEKEFVIFNIYKNSLVALKNNKEVQFLTNNKKSTEQTATDYIRKNFIQKATFTPLENTLYYKYKILCIDSSGVYKTSIEPELILLTQSPKINLERLIEQLHPKEIIADGSNYASYVKKWKETCIKQKIPFHATAEKGLYSIR